MDHDSGDPQSITKTVDSFTENSSHSVDPSASETVVVIKSGENLLDLTLKGDDKHSCAIDMKDFNGERICRICHLDSETKSETKEEDLIQLGCGCKGELEIVHPHCANAWFKLRGNRLCEICGEIAKNVKELGDNYRFMEEWNEMRSINGLQSSERRVGCLRGQPFCNFIMACLIIAFVLPCIRECAEVDEKQLLELIREAIEKIKGEFVPKLLSAGGYETFRDALVGLKQLCSDKNLNPYTISSWCKTGMNEIDFGWGKPIWVGLLSAEVEVEFKNVAVLMDGEKSESIEAWITLDQREMCVLERDHDFLTFASLNPPISL